MHLIQPGQWALLKHYGHMMRIEAPWMMSTDGYRMVRIHSPYLAKAYSVEWLNMDTSDGPIVIGPDTPMIPLMDAPPWTLPLDGKYTPIQDTRRTGWMVSRAAIAGTPDGEIIKLWRPGVEVYQTTKDGCYLIPPESLINALEV